MNNNPNGPWRTIGSKIYKLKAAKRAGINKRRREIRKDPVYHEAILENERRSAAVKKARLS